MRIHVLYVANPEDKMSYYNSLGQFDDLLDATCDAETVVMLRAYMDASKLDSGVFCVAGVAFGHERAIKAERAWVKLYGNMPDGSPRYGHMTDLHGSHGQFADLADNPDERGRLCRESIAIINEYASHVVAISVEASEVVAQLPTPTRPDDEWLRNSYRGVYPCCLHWTLAAMGDSVGHQARGISYWIEAGDEFYGSAAKFLTDLTKPFAKPLRDHYALASSVFLPSEEARLFECADLVAWEWATHVNRHLAGNAKQRASLRPLMKNSPCVTDAGEPYVNINGRYANHYSGWPVKKNLSAMQRLMDASSVSEVRELLAEVTAQSPS